MTGVNDVGQKRRWLDLGRMIHAVYEHCDGHTRTMCGELCQGGSIFHATTKDVRHKRTCKKCLQRITGPRMRGGYDDA